MRFKINFSNLNCATPDCDRINVGAWQQCLQCRSTGEPVAAQQVAIAVRLHKLTEVRHLASDIAMRHPLASDVVLQAWEYAKDEAEHLQTLILLPEERRGVRV